jgi:hypothetical protein
MMLSKKMIRFYGIQKLLLHISGNTTPVKKMIRALPFSVKRIEWVNIGGQLIPSVEFEKFRKKYCVRKSRRVGWCTSFL